MAVFRPADGGQPVLLERAQDGCAGQDGDARVGQHGGQQPFQHRLVVVGAIAQMAAERRAVVEEQDAPALVGRGARRAETGRAAANHGHVGVKILFVVVARRRVGVYPAQAGHVAQYLLIGRPQRRRVDEGLVVEAHRQEAVGQAGQGHGVALQRRPSVLRAHGHPGLDRAGAGAHTWLRADLDEAVGAVTGATQQAARPVVLERAAEDTHAGRGQGRGDGVAGVGAIALAVEGELDRALAVNQFAGAGGEAGGHGEWSVSSIW